MVDALTPSHPPSTAKWDHKAGHTHADETFRDVASSLLRVRPPSAVKRTSESPPLPPTRGSSLVRAGEVAAIVVVRTDSGPLVARRRPSTRPRVAAGVGGAFHPVPGPEDAKKEEEEEETSLPYFSTVSSPCISPPMTHSRSLSRPLAVVGTASVEQGYEMETCVAIVAEEEVEEERNTAVVVDLPVW